VTHGTSIHTLRAASESTVHDEWYTPSEYVEAARLVMGGIDLDPASCGYANAVVKADRIYTKDDDGLSQPWLGRVWMNPPFSRGLINRFASKLVAEVALGNVTQSCVLVNNATETGWFRQIASVSSVICLTGRRLKFYGSEGQVVASLQGQAMLYIGDRVWQAMHVLASLGTVATAPYDTTSVPF
jgi:ParB family chromosome partitioning protein